jgi:hypothetical protein
MSAVVESEWPELAHGSGDSETYEAVTCLTCRQVHMVNPKTGKVLGADEETN